tara:strand:- start:2008 stop:2703 length:696 start_codon:yes stop_codon:yes gene_type:complete
MFTLVIPVFNEEDNLVSLIKEIKTSLINYVNFELIFVNDFSSDNTLKILEKEKKNFNFKILNNQLNLGQSYSILSGIKKSKYNIIVTLDGDGQNNPYDIPKLLELYNKSDDVFLVGGIRSKRKDNLIKIISSRIANYVRSKFLKDGCTDTGCSLKVFDKNIFLKFEYFNGIHRFLPALFNGFGYKTFFLSVDHRKRNYGKSKYGTFSRLFNGLRDMIKVKKMIDKNKEIKS